MCPPAWIGSPQNYIEPYCAKSITICPTRCQLVRGRFSAPVFSPARYARVQVCKYALRLPKHVTERILQVRVHELESRGLEL